MPTRRTIARRLESVEDFDSPSPELEQYLTPPEIAAHLAQLAGLQGDLTDRTVVDLGTGTGMLAIAAAFFDPARVVGVDLDPAALALARENAATIDPACCLEWVRGDVARLPLRTSGVTVFSNPPFGAQRGNRHADRAFLEAARSIGDVSYTIHNEGSRSFVESFAADEGGTVTHAFGASFPLEQRFEFHEAETKELTAEVFRVSWDCAVESDEE